MADLVITAASVLQGPNATVVYGMAGVTLTAGKVVYQDPATGQYLLSDNNLAGAKTAAGITLNGAAAGQPVAVQIGGDITLGAVLTAGKAFHVSGTPGGICPVADLVTGMDVIELGLAKSTTVLALRIAIPGVTL